MKQIGKVVYIIYLLNYYLFDKENYLIDPKNLQTLLVRINFRQLLFVVKSQYAGVKKFLRIFRYY